MEGVERVWHRRLRWRLRGAWQWPAFAALTLLDGIILVVLPPYGGAPEHVFPGVVLAGFVNLLAVVVLAPPLGHLLRRRRPDLPRAIAANYAGATLVAAISVLLVAGGLAHRSAARAEEGAPADRGRGDARLRGRAGARSSATRSAPSTRSGSTTTTTGPASRATTRGTGSVCS